MALDPAAAALVEVSAAVAAGEPEELRAALESASPAATPVEVEETILQAYLFVGFPGALEAMAMWRKVRGGGPTPATGPPRESLAEWHARGEALCRRIYGDAYESLRENVRRLHPALDRWMVEEGYGKVLSRPGLAPLRRELCNVALLAASGHARQLHSHLRGALRLGARPEAVEDALERGLRHASDPAWNAAARRRWAEVRCRAEGSR